MLVISFYSATVAMVANVMMCVCLILSKKSLTDREKFSAFECGFDQKSSSRLPFSLRFFLITIIFLIFDVEIALILPSVMNFMFTSAKSWILFNSVFIVILIVGLFHEWGQGALEWSH